MNNSIFAKIVLTTMATTSFCAAHAQQYGNYTGAGSTTQPSNAYLQQQRQAQNDAQRRANTYYYQPAQPARTPQTQYMQHPSRIPGYPPVVVQLSPQVINSIPSPSPIGCAFGARTGYSFGGVPGAAVGCAAGGFGAPTSRKGAAGKFFLPEQAY